MNKYLKTFFLAILAGLAIGLGGLAYVACSAYETSGVGKILGSVFFSLGLLTVCSFSLFLFTGKIGYVFENKKDYLLHLLLGYGGNVVGACGLGFLCYLTSPFSSGPMGEIVSKIASSRDILSGNGEAWYSALILAFICGILVFIGVDIFKKKPGVVGLIGLILAVTVFVVGGTEHCIANMFYFSAGMGWNLGTILNVLIVTVGNALGSIFFWLLLKLGSPLIQKEKEDNQASSSSRKV